MNCEKCGKEIDYLSIDTFDWDGSDRFETLPITEDTDGSVYVDVEPNWTGYGLSEEEMPETIRCPECGQFPLENREIHAHDMVRVVLFRKEYEADALLAAWNRRRDAPMIEMQPVADAAPVRHGKWKEWDGEAYVGMNKFGKEIYRHFRYYTCSLCCKGSAIKSNYCPNCGARMDGENEMD